VNWWAGSYRTDRNDGIQPKKLNGTQVDFSDYRAGVGVTYAVSNRISVDVGAGYSIERQFDFARAGENLPLLTPRPTFRLQLKLHFEAAAVNRARYRSLGSFSALASS
jgi:hypothetical protein